MIAKLVLSLLGVKVAEILNGEFRLIRKFVKVNGVWKDLKVSLEDSR